MTPADRAALVAWVRAGDEPDLPPRIDQAAERCAAFPHTPRPSWWEKRLDYLKDVANYYPQIGPVAQAIGPGMAAGHPRPAIDQDAPPKKGRARLYPGKLGRPPLVAWQDILAETFPGDSIADVARRLGLARKTLSERLHKVPARKEEFNLRRGIFQSTPQEAAR